MQLKPLPGFVLAEIIEDKETNVGGVYVPETAKDKPARGKVLAVGEDTEEQSSDLKPGQIVVYKRWNGTAIKENGKDLIFIAFEDCLGVYDN